MEREMHDNVIKSYCVDLENQKIVINTEYVHNNKTEITDIAFYNVTGHLFLNVTKNSILFDIINLPLEYFVEENKEILKDQENYGFPFDYTNDEELIEILNKNKQKYFEINSSYGLYGGIIAEEMKIIAR
jgi:archaellum component FlaF (FlaF/FlaG flagellin family)